MATLTIKEDKLYTQLVKDYNKGNWQNVCSLRAYIQVILSKERDILKYQRLQNILDYVENDF